MVRARQASSSILSTCFLGPRYCRLQPPLAIPPIARRKMSRAVHFVTSELGGILESSAQRSIFIRVQPPPVNLAERRAVLRALQRYGEIEMFKKLVVSRACPDPRRTFTALLSDV